MKRGMKKGKGLIQPQTIGFEMTMEYASENADAGNPRTVFELGERGQNWRHSRKR